VYVISTLMFHPQRNWKAES